MSDSNNFTEQSVWKTGNSSAETREEPVAAGSVLLKSKRRLNTRDFINIGVFTALMFAIVWVSGMLGFFGPVMMFPGFLISLIANGMVFALFTSKTPKFGAITIMLIIMESLFAATGHWVGGIGVAVVLGAMADLIITRGPRTVGVRVPLAYALFAITIYVSPWIPLFINRDAYMAGIAQQMGTEYAQQMGEVINPNTLMIFYAVMLLVGLFSGWMGTRVSRKHFERAGLI